MPWETDEIYLELVLQSMLLEGCKRLQHISDISEIPYGGLRNVLNLFLFFFWKYFFGRHKKIKKGKGPRVE